MMNVGNGGTLHVPIITHDDALTHGNVAGLRGVPAQSIGEAIRDSSDMIMADRLLDAVRHAYERGMMTRDESELAARGLL